jgi:hypothetical protein
MAESMHAASAASFEKEKVQKVYPFSKVQKKSYLFERFFEELRGWHYILQTNNESTHTASCQH